MIKVRVRSCDWCNCEIQITGKNADPYIINAERKIFCKVHYKGHEPERDCMDEYLKDITFFRKFYKKFVIHINENHYSFPLFII